VRTAQILVVEDERIVALHLRQRLVKLGYVVPKAVASGRDALLQIEALRPDLILMDVHIEGEIDGIDTAAQIPAEYFIAIIYLTAYSEEGTLERARATKPYGYLIKPFSEQELHATIQMALERCAAEGVVRQRIAEQAISDVSAHNAAKEHVARMEANYLGRTALDPQTMLWRSRSAVRSNSRLDAKTAANSRSR